MVEVHASRAGARELEHPMRVRLPSMSWPAAIVAALAFSFAATAPPVPLALADDAPPKQDEGFDLKIAKGEVTVVAKGEWHINKEFPWKLIVGDVKLDKSKFELGETTARVHDAPAGRAKLRGAICSKDVCRTLERDLDVP
jgi:hypothetical protein